MKYFFIVLLIITSFNSFAQKDSVWTEYDTEHTIEYADADEFASFQDAKYISNYLKPMISNKAINTLFHFSMGIGRLPRFNSITQKVKQTRHEFNRDLDLMFSIEQRLYKATTFSLGLVLPESNELTKNLNRGIGWSTEFRWYKHEHLRIKKGLGKGDFNGQFYGLRFDYYNHHHLLTANQKTTLRSYRFLISTGQRIQFEIIKPTSLNRIGLYLESRLGVGYSELLDDNFGEPKIVKRWGPVGELRFGINLSLSSKRIGEEIRLDPCTINLCSIERNHAFRLDFMNALTNVAMGRLNGTIALGYERKVSKSYFSIYSEMRFDYQWLDFPNLEKDILLLTPSIVLEPRYFLLKKQKIAKGKTSNDLDGGYIGLNFQGRKQFGEDTFFDEKLALTPVMGATITVNPFYLETKMGLGIATLSNSEEKLFDHFYSNYIFQYTIGLLL